MAAKPNFFARMLSFKGRTDKNSFWAAVGVLGTLNVVAIAVLAGATGSTPENPSIPVALLTLASWYPWTALTVRRLHDSNRSGWWLLSFITVAGMIPLIYWLLLSPGTHGENRFGPDPAKREPKAKKPGKSPLRAAPAVASTDPVADLKRLAEMRDDGVLTEDEFAAQKERLLKAV